MFKVFNKIRLVSDLHTDLKTVFAPSTIITVLSDIKTKGFFENKYYIVEQSD